MGRIFSAAQGLHWDEELRAQDLLFVLARAKPVSKCKKLVEFFSRILSIVQTSCGDPARNMSRNVEKEVHASGNHFIFGRASLRCVFTKRAVVMKTLPYFLRGSFRSALRVPTIAASSEGVNIRK